MWVNCTYSDHYNIAAMDNEYILTISTTFKWPMENTIVFGAVATGNMNAKEHAKAAGNIR